MYGAKLYDVPANLDETIDLWHKLNFNTLFLGQKCKTDIAFLERLRAENFFINIIEPTFLADDSIPDERFAITSDGNRAKDTWVRFVCPTDEEWLNQIYKRIENDAKLPVSGLSIDFIRFFQFWETTPFNADYKKLPATCYCPRCNEDKKNYSSEAEWRMAKIESVVEKCTNIIRKTNPDLKIGLHAVPWKKSMFNGAVENLLGQSLNRLYKYVDYFTPMAYHQMVDRPVSYIKELIEDQIEQTEGKVNIVPSIQIKGYYKDVKLSLEENIETIKTAASGKSSGLIFFQWLDLLEKPELLEYLKSHNICK